MGTWKVELDKAAERDLDKFDPQVTRRIERFLYERVATLRNPRLIGEALHGSKLASSGSIASATIASSARSKTTFCECW